MKTYKITLHKEAKAAVRNTYSDFDYDTIVKASSAASATAKANRLAEKADEHSIAYRTTIKKIEAIEK